MSDSTTIHVPHLGGIDAAYKMPHAYDPEKPTLVLVSPYALSLDTFDLQFADNALTDTANLLAIDHIGQGRTRCRETDAWSFWDTATMNLQVLDGLRIGRVFLLGKAQGAWVCMRMALLEPDRIQGISLLSTSLDSETRSTMSRDCWDASAIMTPIIESLTSSHATPDFVLEPEFCDTLLDSGVGDMPSEAEAEFWRARLREVYSGDDGRRRFRRICVNLRDRDGLLGRLGEVGCPVLWLHGTEDPIFTMAQAQHGIKMFTGSREARLVAVKGGRHFLHRSHARAVNGAAVSFVRGYASS